MTARYTDSRVSVLYCYYHDYVDAERTDAAVGGVMWRQTGARWRYDSRRGRSQRQRIMLQFVVAVAPVTQRLLTIPQHRIIIYCGGMVVRFEEFSLKYEEPHKNSSRELR